MTATETHSLLVGQKYEYNFAGCPSGIAIFRGFSEFDDQWAVFEKGGKIGFYNLRLLCRISPVVASS